MNNNRSIIIGVCVSAFLLIGIVAAILVLYSDKGRVRTDVEKTTVSHASVLQAVPADAAFVFCFQNARSGIGILGDRSHCLRTLTGGNASFGHFLVTLRDSLSLKTHPMALSVHYSDGMVPLMILETGHGADTTEYESALMDGAQACGLKSALAQGEEGVYLLVSPSESLVESSARHLVGGTSILDDPGFAELAARRNSHDVLFVAHDYLGKAVAAFCQKPLYPYAPFLRDLAEWTAFDIRQADGKRLLMTGSARCGKSPAQYANLLSGLTGGELRGGQALPAVTETALFLAVPDAEDYLKAYERYLDASQSLSQFRRTCDTLTARTGRDPRTWLKESGVRELVRADWAGTSVVMLRLAKASKEVVAVEAFPYGAFPAALFGDVFDIGDAVSCLRRGEWLVVGSATALSAYQTLLDGQGSLQEVLSQVSQDRLLPGKESAAAFYFSVSDAAGRLPLWFRPGVADDLKMTLEGVIREPMVLSWGAEGLRLEVARPTDYAERKSGGKRVEAGKKADVEVPQGPFEVMNCGTGKPNLFYQTSNLSLCLKDKESGKGLWGVSFDQPICGAVGTVDIFANGKLQFLFAAGSKLYLIDRLGRFVTGFPVELGKEVLLGPAVYDFSDDKNYTVLVLHKDNTIGMYDLHGVQPAGWRGITSPHTIVSLPVPGTADGKAVWVVQTAGGEQVYDFLGGEPLKAKSIKNLTY